MARAFNSFAALAAAAALVLLMAAGAHADCSLPCSCAYGLEFGESLCNYANFTMDVKAFQDTLAKPEPDFADALSIYNVGRYTWRANATRPLTVVTKRNYGQESYYLTSATYFKSEFYIDSFMGAALRGEGAYANACCGVRAEVASAGAHWFLAAYSIHEVDAGVCYATGCNNRTKNLPLASEEVLHGITLMTGANSAADPNGPAGTTNPATLFRASDDAGTFFCTQKKPRAGKPAPMSALNTEDVAAHVNASAAAAAGDTAALASHYSRIEKALTARFLQYSLQQAYDASKAASKAVLDKAGACRSPCLRQAQQAAARTYFRAVEPIIARTQPELVAQANELLGAASPRNTFKKLSKAYQAIVTGMGLDQKQMLAKCKV